MSHLPVQPHIAKRRRITCSAAAGLVLVALILGGCGLGSSTNKEAISKAPNTPQNASKTFAAEQAQVVSLEKKNFAKLPKPAANSVTVASGSSLGITPDVIKAFEKTNPGVNVTDQTTSPSEAFNELCAGKVDVAETTRPPSAEELQACTANGITFHDDANGNPEPIELAADGIVVATKNDSDVGGDCLKLSTVRAIFQPGSVYHNWSQVGFDNLPLGTSGREARTDDFQLFASLVLGTEGNATLGDVRADYRPNGTDAGTQELVTNDDRIDALRKRINRVIAFRLKHDHPQLVRAMTRAEDAANAAALAKIRVANRILAKSKKVLTKAQKRAIDNANAALDNNLKVAAVQTAQANLTAQIKHEVDQQYAPQLAALQRTGVLGVFRFSYYELYEDKLRPMEIWDPTTTQTELSEEGIASSETTKLEQISNKLREQAGGGVSNVTTLSFPATPTTGGVQFDAAGAGEVTVPQGGAVDVNTTPNCIFPSTTTITSGVYPLSVRLLAYVPENRLKRLAVTNYLGYYLLDGENTVQDDRLVPLGDTQRQSEYKAVTGKSVPEADLLKGQNPAGGSAPIANAEGAITAQTEGGSGSGAGSGSVTSSAPVATVTNGAAAPSTGSSTSTTSASSTTSTGSLATQATVSSGAGTPGVG